MITLAVSKPEGKWMKGTGESENPFDLALVLGITIALLSKGKKKCERQFSNLHVLLRFLELIESLRNFRASLMDQW